jgi:hypothetical protein
VTDEGLYQRRCARVGHAPHNDKQAAIVTV